MKELSAEQVGEEANALLSSINALAAQSKPYRQAMKDASPEDQKVMELQAGGVHKRLVDEIHRLGD